MSLSSPEPSNPLTRPLRRGDLVRLSESAIHKSKRYHDREHALGRIAAVDVKKSDDNNNKNEEELYDVEWILEGGKYSNCYREDLIWRSADQEGFTDVNNNKRQTRKPIDFMQEVTAAAAANDSSNNSNNNSNKKKKQIVKKQPPKKSTTTSTAKRKKPGPKRKTNNTTTSNNNNRKAAPKRSISNLSSKSQTTSATSAIVEKSSSKKRKLNHNNKQNKLVNVNNAATTEGQQPKESTTTTTITTTSTSTSTNALDLYERQRREFERFFTRIRDKVDCFRHFWDDNIPTEYQEDYYNPTATLTNTEKTSITTQSNDVDDNKEMHSNDTVVDDQNSNKNDCQQQEQQQGPIFPSHPPYNWQMIIQRMEHGRYELDRRQKEQDDRFQLFGPYYDTLGKKKPTRKSFNNNTTTPESDNSNNGKKKNTKNSSNKQQKTVQQVDIRVLHPKGVHWDLFRDDVFAMCDAAYERQSQQDKEEDDGQRGTMSYTIKKIKEAVLIAIERTGTRHTSELDFADDRHKFALAVENKRNYEAAMQSWRKIPFPERKYERLQDDVVCAGLSQVDERIASYELQTNLPDSFIGLSYRYNDTGQSEAWMKSVVDETGPDGKSSASKKKRRNNNNSSNSNNKKQQNRADPERQAALALSADEGVIRAQVHSTMQSLLISVQDKVMTDTHVLQQPELRSANWMIDDNNSNNIHEQEKQNINNNSTGSTVTVTNNNDSDCNNNVDTTSTNKNNDWIIPNKASSSSPVDLENNVATCDNKAAITNLMPNVEYRAINATNCDSKKDAIMSPLTMNDTTIHSSSVALPEPYTTAPIVSSSDCSPARVDNNDCKMEEEYDHTATTGTISNDMCQDCSQEQLTSTSTVASASASNSPAKPSVSASSSELDPEIVEQPVWGIDCYTRRNILSCLEVEFDPRTALLFTEKWLLPAINACPEDLAHDIANAARILEGLPFENTTSSESNNNNNNNNEDSSAAKMRSYDETLLGKALAEKIQSIGPVWLKPAANQLRRARVALGPDFFRVHPKGHGSVVLTTKLPPNRLVTFYRGELYPSWRWGEKMDAIEITQRRKNLKPALPDFYNMALERPQMDPRGYGLLFVDASRKAGHGSSLSHSCAPTCEVRVAAHNGELCLAMTTLRELEMGEELTFDYNAVTESLNEYRSAVCLCGYGRCRGSFLHFATADCYQQVLNRNSPIATRFSNLIKGSMKQVMSPDDEKVLHNHGFLTAAFGAISVNRRGINTDGNTTKLADSMDVVPVWLRTYVADTLRYIEYERRALPIALICDHLSSNKSKTKSTTSSEPEKEPKPEPSFFYFTRTETDFILGLLRKEGFPESLNGLQLKHTMQKVASTYWSSLDAAEKLEWKEKARKDYEKKLKAWRSSKKSGNTSEKSLCQPEMDDILNKSKISFQDADAEGVAAMEQRIQQLTQSLSRIGRVLDRHREGSIGSISTNEMESLEKIRKMVDAPLRVLSHEEIIGWMWNGHNGVVPCLMSSIEKSLCVRPQLRQACKDVFEKNKCLSDFADPSEPKKDGTSTVEISNKTHVYREQLKQALMDFRSVLLTELNAMSKEYRQFESQMKEGKNKSSNKSVDNDCSGDELAMENDDSIIESMFDTQSIATNEGLDVATTDSVSAVSASQASSVPKNDEDDNGKTTCDDSITSDSHSWLDHYADRVALQAAADALLFYANTSNFFIVQPYRELESTPIEVYARELGNSVPKSVIDSGLEDDSDRPTTVAVGVTPVKERKKTQPNRRTAESGPNDTGNDEDLCAPDDIIATVSVRYQGDFVLSQLLQWYNGGIGQKPGLPDLFGCTLLPNMADCWDSKLLRRNKIKPGRKTTYETKVRPRLIEWMQDPYQRGNPWPAEIRRAFESDDPSRTNGCNDFSFLPFGSPVIDFLVSGDESGIGCILEELDADDKVKAKKKADGLLSSVDKGRPAQAVSTWVQCEHPNCMKWRKIPWHVDADLLPEKFYCTDNIWNTAANTCDAPEDDWDEADALVGSDGKVEGSPVKKRDEKKLDVNDQSSFTIGTRFDVRRSDKNTFSVATVTKVDFSGSVKRIMFHYAKTSSDRDEWVEFGSSRIAPLHSKVARKDKKVDQSKDKIKKTKPLQSTADNCQAKDDGKPAKKPTTEKKLSKEEILDPSVESNFKIGARFDVERKDKGRFYHAKVKQVDFSSDVKRVLFHFSKTKVKFDEWIDFGSPRICAYNSKVLQLQQEKEEQAKDKEKTKAPKDSKKREDLEIRDPSQESSFKIGARFDVERKDKGRFYHAEVKQIDFSSDRKNIFFHFAKINAKYDEWIEFGSPRICAYNSMVPLIQLEKEERAKEKEELEKAKALKESQKKEELERAKIEKIEMKRKKEEEKELAKERAKEEKLRAKEELKRAKVAEKRAREEKIRAKEIEKLRIKGEKLRLKEEKMLKREQKKRQREEKNRFENSKKRALTDSISLSKCAPESKKNVSISYSPMNRNESSLKGTSGHIKDRSVVPSHEQVSSRFRENTPVDSKIHEGPPLRQVTSEISKNDSYSVGSSNQQGSRMYACNDDTYRPSASKNSFTGNFQSNSSFHSNSNVDNSYNMRMISKSPEPRSVFVGGHNMIETSSVPNGNSMSNFQSQSSFQHGFNDFTNGINSNSDCSTPASFGFASGFQEQRSFSSFQHTTSSDQGRDQTDTLGARNVNYGNNSFYNTTTNFKCTGTNYKRTFHHCGDIPMSGGGGKPDGMSALDILAAVSNHQEDFTPKNRVENSSFSAISHQPVQQFGQYQQPMAQNPMNSHQNNFAMCQTGGIQPGQYFDPYMGQAPQWHNRPHQFR